MFERGEKRSNLRRMPRRPGRLRQEIVDEIDSSDADARERELEMREPARL
jgi:hypothetical protein